MAIGLVTRNGGAASQGTRLYVPFLNELRAAILAPNDRDIVPLLNGLAAERCLTLLRPKSLRRLGAFFTPSDLAQRIVRRFRIEENETEIQAFDPACGAGDLLLAIARKLPRKPTVSATLQYWNTRIAGCDISSEFVDAARLRLALLAIERGSELDGSPAELIDLLSKLVVADGLSVSEQYSLSSHIVMNPPFGRVYSGPLSWRDGSVTAAALFLERAARLAAPGTQIVALLPEVLRTGSSYENWRNHIGQLVFRSRPSSVGLFSDHADVDVFIQRFIKRSTRTRLAKAGRRRKDLGTVGDRFLVSVGSVVPHRHQKRGPEFAYLHPNNAAAWAEIRRLRERRKFQGRTFTPPFVVVRRTSRPGDRFRATATLVHGARRIAVENHLIVLSPRNGKLAECRALMRLLRSSRINEALNRLMRCRHLTTGSVTSLAW